MSFQFVTSSSISKHSHLYLEKKNKGMRHNVLVNALRNLQIFDSSTQATMLFISWLYPPRSLPNQLFKWSDLHLSIGSTSRRLLSHSHHCYKFNSHYYLRILFYHNPSSWLNYSC